MRIKKEVKRGLSFIRGFVFFFLTISITVSVSLMPFLSNMELNPDKIQHSARITFVNVMILSLLFTIIDEVRRKYTVERPANRILEATQNITEGDFSTRIEPFHGLEKLNEFDLIIENFNIMAKELSSIETLRTDFIANVSHELKTPLAVIQNYATMLQDKDLSEEKRIEYSVTIADATRRFSELITNILKLNKLENQQIYPKAKRYNLGEQLCESMLLFEDAWEKKNLEIEVDIAEDVEVLADAELLTLVWNNLFSNAVKFTAPGGRVTVTLETESGFAVVKVSDTGCGIPPEVGAHIFDKFYQGDTSHAMQGNGLGLALVKRVVGIVGGEISVKSQVGQGSTFIVRLSRELNKVGQNK